MKKLIGPFTQLITMDKLPERGPIDDAQLEVLSQVGIVIENGIILGIGKWKDISSGFQGDIHMIDHNAVVLPGVIDCHTHICYGGSRREDYAARLAGVSYQEISKRGGGIWSTVNHTREKSREKLTELTIMRLQQLQSKGITTCEIKSGYGLSVTEELKILRAIHHAGMQSAIDVIPTCLAAHVVPKEFKGNGQAYLELIVMELLPMIQKEGLASRVDIFIEQGAFEEKEAKIFLDRSRSMGFDLTVHGDQFTTGGSRVAIDCRALSVDHLEASGEKEIGDLAQSDTIGVALPGASLGLGCDFAPVRKLLDKGGKVAIASDWNPGSAPMGDLWTQAAILGTMEKLTNAETMAGITLRAAQALNLKDRGAIKVGYKADFIIFSVDDYRDILYHQGQLKPFKVFIDGNPVII